MYALYFLMVTVVCVFMMSPTVEQEIKTHVSTRKFPLFAGSSHLQSVLLMRLPYM